MRILYRNDRKGEYPPSWYAATADLAPERSPLKGEVRADVAIVGAGFTDLTAALRLAQKGFRVAVVEAHRVGFGASGRNGGQAGLRFNMYEPDLEKRLGKDRAKALHDLSFEAIADLKALVAEHAPEARFTPGIAHGAWSTSELDELRRYKDHLETHYGETGLEFCDEAAFRGYCNSPVYKGAILDWEAGHIHPLRYCLGLARAAEAAGVTIYEGSEAHQVKAGLVHTGQGRIVADNVLLAGNGYLPNLDRRYAARVMPINSFIAATEPLGDLADAVLPRDVAVADEKFVVNYFRLSEDRRLLFGGRENYGIGFPTDITTKLRQRMLKLFPQLASTRIDYV